MANLITSDFGFGGDAYPGEEPQAKAFNRDYTDAYKPYRPSEKKNWVVSEGRLFIDEDVPSEDAAGTMEVEHNWHATFTVLHSGMALKILGKVLKKWCSDHNMLLKQMVDREGNLLPWNKTAEAIGIGERNPGVMDWMNKEWAEDSLDTDYPGFQDPTRGNEPGLSFDDKAMTCPHCHIELENQAEWLLHQMYAHNEPLPKPPPPVVDLDDALPAGYNEVSRGAGEPGITTGKVAASIADDAEMFWDSLNELAHPPSSGSEDHMEDHIDPHKRWMDNYTGEDAIRVPFYMDDNFQVKWMGTPGDWHATSELPGDGSSYISGEVVYSNFGPPQIHYTFGKGDVLPNDDPRATPILMKSRKKMMDFRKQIKNGETPQFDSRLKYNWDDNGFTPSGYGEDWAKMVHQPGWVDSFRFSSDWLDPTDMNVFDGRREWADNYTGDDGIRVPFYMQNNRVVWIGNPGDHHGRSEESDRLYNENALGGEVLFTNFGPPVVHFSDSPHDVPYTDPRATEPYMKARVKMMEWRKQLSKGQSHTPDRWDTVPNYTDWDAKIQRPGWAQSFKLTATDNTPWHLFTGDGYHEGLAKYGPVAPHNYTHREAAIRPEDLSRHMHANGPLMFHGSHPQNIVPILRNGILPWDQTGTLGKYMEHSTEKITPRKNHGYIGAYGYVHPTPHFYGPWIAANLAKINPKHINANEEEIWSGETYPEDHELHRAKDPTDGGPYDERDAVVPQSLYFRNKDQFDTHDERPNAPGSQGEWAERFKKRIDHPDSTRRSLQQGSVAVNGGVPAEALQLSPYDFLHIHRAARASERGDHMPTYIHRFFEDRWEHPDDVHEDNSHFVDDREEHSADWQGVYDQLNEYMAEKVPGGENMEPDALARAYAEMIGADYHMLAEELELERALREDPEYSDYTWSKVSADAPIAGPIPWLYDSKDDKIYVGHPGDGPQDVQAPDYNAFGIVEGYYFPDGELRIMETSNIPITIRHLIKLWYYMHPELEVKKVMLEYTDLGGVKKRQKLAAEDVAARVHQLLVADPAAHTAALALGHHGNVYVVGGAIRDLALGREPKDIDLMVQGIDADTVEKILKQLPGRVDFTGKAFGVFRYRTREGFDVEIAMPRTEASTGAGHKDFEVKTDHNLPIETDLARRDFTGNAMAFDLKRGELIDPYNGWEDLQQRKLRTTSEFSFPDDPLRIMRGLASRSRHGLIPDEETKAAMRQNAPNLKHLPAERIQAELDKLMGGDHPADAIRLAQETGVLEHFMPELSRTHNFDQQNKYHNQVLFDHTMTVLDHVAKNSDDKDLRYMAMLHDIGKPDSKWIDNEGWAHYYKNEHGIGLDHEDHGAHMARELMQRLKFPRARTERVEHLVRHHMFPEFKSEAGARKFMNRVGPDHADDLMLMREGDLKGKPAQNDVGNMRNLIQSVRAKKDPTGAASLAINGKDLIAMGVPPGKGLGGILQHLLEMVLENPALNQRETLLQMAREYNAAV